MGDRCTVWFRLGGNIPRPQAIELIRRMTFEGLQVDLGEPDINNLHEGFWGYEVNYGLIDSVTDYCRAHGVAYELWNESGGGYSAGIKRFDGTQEISCTSDHEMQALVPISDILQVETLASGLADLIKLAKFFSGDLPPVVIVEPSGDLTESDKP